MFTLRARCDGTARGQGEAGAAALELGLMAPFLILLVVGAVDLGSAVYKGMEAQNAAEAGAVFASKYGLNVAGISAAVANATGSAGITATPTPAQFCGCPTTTGIASTACTSACGDGSAPGQYVRINARITHQTMFSSTGLTLPATITGEAVVRLY